ncbi:glycosyltransferase [Flammeovirga sp. SubArs3]|uniref:glycosyltransferase n=1 Tax=Flammeovirga sp. SubArs3 TaxID=2995316 RepID=UPI00248BF970|nr:glycosyltransferase [Flammeovirga sp. SubArs3]
MKYYIVIASNGIGGAETRALKLTHYLVNESKLDVEIVLNQKLLEAYQKNRFCAYILEHNKIKTHVISESGKFDDTFINKALKDHRLYKTVKYAPKPILKKLSWYNILNDLVKSEQDIVHCFHGESARLGTLFFSQNHRNRVIFEITSNRHVHKWAEQLNRFDFDESLHVNINCVSQTVHNNLKKYLKEDHLKLTNHYSGPFLYFPRLYDIPKKEDIICFAHRFVSTKNAILFAESVKEFYSNEENKKWKVIFRGKGADEEQINNILGKEIAEGLVEVSYTDDLQYDLKKTKIFVSIITTGNFPSNSVFEAMNYENLLLLSDTGITKEKFNFDEVTYCDLTKESVLKAINDATQLADSKDYMSARKATKAYYDGIVNRMEYIKDLAI